MSKYILPYNFPFLKTVCPNGRVVVETFHETSLQKTHLIFINSENLCMFAKIINPYY